LVEELNGFRYRQQFHMSYQDFANEPIEAINFAYLVWNLESAKEQAEARRNKPL
jgi:hypothetical protein